MAAARSPSPTPVRSAATCRGCRNLDDITSPMRRSMDSTTPFRLSNPSDSPQRSIGSKNGAGQPSPRSCSEKENERDPASSLKAAKARSAVSPSPKSGAKSFMAPTISAASKAVSAAASPRKKILGERNELVRPSSLEPHQIKEVAFDSRSPKLPPEEAVTVHESGQKPESGLRSLLSLGGSESKMEDLGFKNPHPCGGFLAASSSPSSAIASLDADPSVPPYDPKTNYLSPRPRFLHYKPNPRIEQYRHGHDDDDDFVLGDGKGLEESFSSESDDATTEEALAVEERSSSLQKDSEKESASSDAEAEAIPAETRATKPETRPNSRQVHVKSRSFAKFLLAPLALVLLIACIGIPLSDSSVMSYSSMLRTPVFLSVQELHPVDLAARLRHWSSSSFASFAFYLATLNSPGEQEFGPHCAANLSAAATDAVQAAGLYSGFVETSLIKEEPISLRDSEQEVEKDPGHEMEKTESYVSAGDTELAVEPDTQMVQTHAIVEEAMEEEGRMEHDVTDPNVQEEANGHDDLAVEEERSGEMSEEEIVNHSGEEFGSLSQNLEFSSDESVLAEPEKVENPERAESFLHSDAQGDESDGDGFNDKEQQPAYPDLQSEEVMNFIFGGKMLTPASIGAASVATVVAAMLAFFYMTRKQHLIVEHDNAPAKKIETRSASGSSESYLLARGSRLQNSAVDDYEMFDDSGASRYSSSLNDSSLLSRRQRSRKANEEGSLSHETRARRESATYSSASYGSFTTYEKKSAKKGGKDEEAMTPVRRSSRLRNHVMSP